MHPVLFRVGPLTLHTYGLLVAIGVLLGLWQAQRQAARAGLDPDRVWNLGIYMVLAALVGAKLWLVLADWSYYWEHPHEILWLSTLLSGGTYYGGFLAALGGGLLLPRRFGLKLFPLGGGYSAPPRPGPAHRPPGC